MKGLIKLLREEIKWCKGHKYKGRSLTQLEKNGFIKGLRHAIRLAQMIK